VPDRKASQQTANQAITKLNKIDFKNHIVFLRFKIYKVNGQNQLLIKRRSWKTTTSVNLAASLGVLEKKVLLIDADPQANEFRIRNRCR
jgi:AAA15 family ATPase/GTPase